MNILHDNRRLFCFGGMALLLLVVGFFQSWNLMFQILNLCLISAVMSLGVNIQWGYVGLFNVGVMGFAALGGLSAVLISTKPVQEAWQAGGTNILISLFIVLIGAGLIFLARHKLSRRAANYCTFLLVVLTYFAARYFYIPGTKAVEAVDPALTGFLGGLGLPIIFSWLVGGVVAGCAAWFIGKITLGLRSDYLAIATLGISEILILAIKNEDWLARGVKNVIGLSRPVAYERDLQASGWFVNLAETLGMDLVTLSSLWVKISYTLLFLGCLVFLLILAELALKSPWGRMMRAIRDNETAAHAMGKDIVARKLQVFVLGSMVVGIGGAMLTTLDGQFTPTSYQPLRFTFLIWVMVIVGGSGNNWGAILGGFLIWFVWIEAEPVGLWLMEFITSGMDEQSSLKQHLIRNAAYMRLLTMGLILLVVLKYFPKGLIPEGTR